MALFIFVQDNGHQTQYTSEEVTQCRICKQTMACAANPTPEEQICEQCDDDFPRGSKP